jgi:hypothetical protein
MKKNSPVQNILTIALTASKEIAQGVPSRIRPLIEVALYVFTLGILLVMMPFVILLKFVQKPSRDAFLNLQTDLETVWKSESSLIALTKLRNIYHQLYQNLDKVIGITGYTIVPYGKFRFYEYDKVRELLYYWEVQHRHWKEALALCDELLEIYLKNRKPPHNPNVEIWIVRKAKIITNIEGTTAAQQYLLQYINPEQEESLVNTYLYELRNQPPPYSPHTK